MTPIETELQKATGVKPKKNQQRTDYLIAVINAIGELTDDAWNTLSPEAQEWANTGISANNNGDEVPDFETASNNQEEEGAEPEPKTENTTMATKSKKPTAAKHANGKKNGATAAAPAKKKAAVSAKPPGARKLGSGGPVLIMRMLTKDPNMSKQDIADKLHKQGVKLSDLTIATQRSNFRSACRVLVDEGLLKMEI